MDQFNPEKKSKIAKNGKCEDKKIWQFIVFKISDVINIKSDQINNELYSFTYHNFL